MLAIDYDIIMKIMFLYSMVIITLFFARKYTKMTPIKNYKTIVIIFAIIFILEIGELCLYITPELIIKSEIEMNNTISMIMSMIIYISLLLTVVMRAAIILTIERALTHNKFGCVIWAALVIILVLHDMFNIIDMNVYILGCVITLGMFRRYENRYRK